MSTFPNLRPKQLYLVNTVNVINLMKKWEHKCVLVWLTWVTAQQKWVQMTDNLETSWYKTQRSTSLDRLSAALPDNTHKNMRIKEDKGPDIKGYDIIWIK